MPAPRPEPPTAPCLWPQQQQVVPAGRGDLERAPRHRLPPHVGQVVHDALPHRLGGGDRERKLAPAAQHLEQLAQRAHGPHVEPLDDVLSWPPSSELLDEPADPEEPQPTATAMAKSGAALRVAMRSSVSLDSACGLRGQRGSGAHLLPACVAELAVEVATMHPLGARPQTVAGT